MKPIIVFDPLRVIFSSQKWSAKGPVNLIQKVPAREEFRPAKQILQFLPMPLAVVWVFRLTFRLFILLLFIPLLLHTS